MEIQSPNSGERVFTWTLGHFGAQALFNNGRNQPGERAAQMGNFANQFCTEITVGFARQHEYGFQARLEFAIHQRHLEFVFVVGYRANAAKDDGGAAFSRVFHEQSLENVNFHGIPLFCDLPEHVNAFIQREQRLFVDVLQNGDNQLVEHFFPALDEVQMPVGYGVKRAGIDSDRSLHSVERGIGHIVTQRRENAREK
jgi:hypothetical protein